MKIFEALSGKEAWVGVNPKHVSSQIADAMIAERSK